MLNCQLALDTNPKQSFTYDKSSRQASQPAQRLSRIALNSHLCVRDFKNHFDVSEIAILSITDEIKITVNIIESLEANITRFPLRGCRSRAETKQFRSCRPQTSVFWDKCYRHPYRQWLLRADIIKTERRELIPNKLLLKDSHLGWILTGRYTTTHVETI